MAESDMATTSFQLPKPLLEKVQEHCRQEHIKPSQLYRKLVYDFFEREKLDSL